MSDSISNPLLSKPADSHPDQPKREQPASLDETIEKCIGEFGFAQLIQAILVSFAWVFDAQQTFISILTDAEPTWHCTQPGNYNNSSSSCTPVSNICQLPSQSWAWNRPVYASVISEWELQCANSVIKGLPASSFFTGCLAGGLILATLADSSLGRKKMLFFTSLWMALSALLTVFATNIWMYSALKFLIGFSRATIGTCALVLSTELVGKRWRGQVGVISYFCFAIGFLSLPAIAYVNRESSWRILYLWTSIPTILYCMVVHLFVRESPRWLFIRGRKEEAVTILKSIAPAKSDDRGLITMSFSNVTFVQEDSCDSGGVDLYSAIKILLERKWSSRRLFAVMFAGFGIGMVYYGMPLGLGNLAFNLYLSTVLNALSELPSALVIFILIGKLNRKHSLLVFTVLSGVSSILCVVMSKVSNNLQIGLELLAFCSTCTAFNVLLIYTIELFPTRVRNSALAMVRQALVFGGAFSPVLVAAGGREGVVSYGVFGLVIGICGLFVACLPETRGSSLCDTMEEEEHKLERSSSGANGVIIIA